jgi:hypothetical protein
VMLLFVRGGVRGATRRDRYPNVGALVAELALVIAQTPQRRAS